MAEKNQPKIQFAYTVTRNEDGSVDVKDAGLEGVAVIPTEKIYEDIEAVAQLIERKRLVDASFAAAYNAVAKFYSDAAQAQKASQAATVEKTPKQ
jgi:hypothetical protein